MPELSAQMIWASEQLNSVPAPEHSIGNIVIVPPGDYGLVRSLSLNLTNPPSDWVYGICCIEDFDRLYYFPAKSVTKRGN